VLKASSQKLPFPLGDTVVIRLDIRKDVLHINVNETNIQVVVDLPSLGESVLVVDIRDWIGCATIESFDAS